MEAHSLYATVLAIRSPWHVTGVRLPPGEQAVEVLMALDDELELRCPACAQPAPRYDSRERRWRHLDTCRSAPSWWLM